MNLKHISILLVIILVNTSIFAFAQDDYIKHKKTQSSVIPHSSLNITINSEYTRLNRSESTFINYKIRSRSVETIKILVPYEFEDIPIMPITKNCTLISEDNKHSIKVKLGGASKEKISEISYLAKVSTDLPLKNGKHVLILDKKSIIIEEGLGEAPLIGSCEIQIYNNPPKIEPLMFNRLSEYEGEDINFLKNEKIQLFLRANDVEDCSLNYTLFEKGYPVHNGSINGSKVGGLWTYNASLNYITSEPTYIKILLFDNDKGHCEYIKEIAVKNYSLEEKKRSEAIKYIIIIALIFILFLPFRSIFRTKGKILVIVLTLLIIYLTFSDNDNIKFVYKSINFEIITFIYILSYFSYFIESNFQTLESKPPKTNKRNGSLLDDIRYKVKNNFSQSDFKLYIFSTLGMTIMLLLIVFLIPNSDIFNIGDTPDKFNYIFWYYSMLTQTFGSILAIIVAFTTWSFGGKNNSKNNGTIKIKSFMLLYISLILLSIIGLAIGTVPPMSSMLQIVNNPLDRLAIVTLESTLLLISPAFACLYELSKLTINQMNNKSKVSLFPPKP